MSVASSIPEPLVPLVEALGRRCLRLVARPGFVMVDRPEGESRTLDLAWDEQQHAAALAVIAVPQTLHNGVVVASLQRTIILHQAVDPLWRLDDMVRDGWLSPVCGRFLSAALGLGRNILVAGPWGTAAALITALVGEGHRPAILSAELPALPRRFGHVRSWRDAQVFGADRVAAWDCSVSTLVAAMGQLCGMVGWIDARRLDRALVRFEVGAEASAAPGNTPLHVLAGLDLVVVVGSAGGPRVREVSEILLTEQGYRPQLLFAIGVAPAPAALVPLMAPTFVDELAQSGHSLLAEELRSVHSHGAGVPTTDEPEDIPPTELLRPANAPAYLSTYPEPQPLLHVPPDETNSAPGWELDRLRDGGSELRLAVPPTTEDEAVMAATYGLAPPPRPGSATRSAPVPTSFAETFHEHGNDVQHTDLKPVDPEDDP